jgi:hypothetical protein
MLDGIWTNTASIVLRFGNGSGDTVTIPTNEATYVGTMYATSNGTTKVMVNPAPALGGNATVVGLWNAYNRVSLTTKSCDSTSGWTYASNVWRNVNASAANRITWVDGLQQTSVTATYGVVISTTLDATQGVYLSIGVDGIVPTFITQGFGDLTLNDNINVAPLMGLHYAQAIEFSYYSNTVYFYGHDVDGQHQQLTLTGEF